MPQNEARAGTRWWWLGSAVDKENLQWTMQQYADHGIGAVEITPIYGVKDNQKNNIPFLSDQWMEMLREVQQNGRKMGIEVDMSLRWSVGHFGRECGKGGLRRYDV